MSQQSVHPGQIWPGKPLSADLLEVQWDLEFRHQTTGLSLSAIVFSDSDWLDWDWNAREAIHLNSRWPGMPHLVRHFFLPQNQINLHLLRSTEKLLQAWQQWIRLPQVKTLPDFPPAAECAYLLMSARSQYDQACEKHHSLLRKGKLVQHMSMRQRRFYQYLSGLFRDLGPLVRAAPDLPGNTGSPSLKDDIAWHTRELERLLGKLDLRPGLDERLRLPRLEVNRLLAASCLYSCEFLKGLVYFQ